jgi:hypothetical protein
MQLVVTQVKVGDLWTLDLGEDALRLLDPQGAVTSEFPRAEADRRILLPSFSENRKAIWFLAAADRVVHLNPDKPAVAAIKDYLNQSIALAGPEAIADLKKKGYRDLAIGAVSTVAGVVVTAVSLAHPSPSADGQGKSTIMYGLILFGLIMVGRGIAALIRASKIQTA